MFHTHTLANLLIASLGLRTPLPSQPRPSPPNSLPTHPQHHQSISSPAPSHQQACFPSRGAGRASSQRAECPSGSSPPLRPHPLPPPSLGTPSLAPSRGLATIPPPPSRPEQGKTSLRAAHQITPPPPPSSPMPRATGAARQQEVVGRRPLVWAGGSLSSRQGGETCPPDPPRTMGAAHPGGAVIA